MSSQIIPGHSLEAPDLILNFFTRNNFGTFLHQKGKNPESCRIELELRISAKYPLAVEFEPEIPDLKNFFFRR